MILHEPLLYNHVLYYEKDMVVRKMVSIILVLPCLGLIMGAIDSIKKMIYFFTKSDKVYVKTYLRFLPLSLINILVGGGLGVLLIYMSGDSKLPSGGFNTHGVLSGGIFMVVFYLFLFAVCFSALILLFYLCLFPLLYALDKYYDNNKALDIEKFNKLKSELKSVGIYAGVLSFFIIPVTLIVIDRILN